MHPTNDLATPVQIGADSDFVASGRSGVLQERLARTLALRLLFPVCALMTALAVLWRMRVRPGHPAVEDPSGLVRRCVTS